MSFASIGRSIREMRTDVSVAPIGTGPAPARRREWEGLALLALSRCGMSREEIRAVLRGDDAGLVRGVWNCFRRG
jgi:hypothetical protein